MTVVLDAGSKGAATVITGGLHASATNNSENGARGDLKHDNTTYPSPRNRYWFEFTNNFVSLSTDSGTGLTPAASPNYTNLASNAAGGLIIYRSGAAFLNGASIGGIVTGGIRFESVMFAVDFDNNLMWAKTAGTDWNSALGPGGDPDTGVLGIDISSIVAGGLYPVGVITSLANSFDANFGASAPVNTPPSTYGPWDGSVPVPPPTPTLSVVQNARMAPFKSVATATAQKGTIGATMLATEAADTLTGTVGMTVGMTMLATEAPDRWTLVPPDRANVGALNIPAALRDDDVIYVLEDNATIFVQGDFSSSFLIPSEETLIALPFTDL